MNRSPLALVLCSLFVACRPDPGDGHTNGTDTAEQAYSVAAGEGVGIASSLAEGGPSFCGVKDSDTPDDCAADDTGCSLIAYLPPSGPRGVYTMSMPFAQFLTAGTSGYIAGPSSLNYSPWAPRTNPWATAAHPGIVTWCPSGTRSACGYGLALDNTGTPDVVPVPLTYCLSDSDCTVAGIGDTCETLYTCTQYTDAGASCALASNGVCGQSSTPEQAPTAGTWAP